nr:unnamed protein product [Callosobruchus analis]
MYDPGSMSNFMTRESAQSLGVNIDIEGVNGSANSVFKQIKATVLANSKRYKTCENFLIADRVTSNLPLISFDKNLIHIPDGITLADENFSISAPVQILFGADAYYRAVRTGQIKTDKNSPVITETAFGWILGGYSGAIDKQKRTVCNLQITNEQLYNELEGFGKLESIPEKRELSMEESECEKRFVKTHQCDYCGQFIMCLPFKDNIERVGNTEGITTQKFLNLEKKLDRNERSKEMYIEFMREYERLGHMTQINTKNEGNAQIFYLTHHGVYREGSSTTKLRVVFDASAQSDTGLSLNYALRVGPILQRELFLILLSFRAHNVVIIADIEKMYRQILVNDKDRKFQQIVWREDKDAKLKHYKLNTVTYGTSSASFLAVRALHQAADDYVDRYPRTSRAIKRDFYKDDFISGGKSN